MPNQAISWKVQKGLKWNLVYRKMAVKTRAVHKNHNLTLYIYRVISPQQFYFYILVACPGHTLDGTKGIKMKLGLYIDGSELKGSAQEP